MTCRHYAASLPHQTGIAQDRSMYGSRYQSSRSPSGVKISRFSLSTADRRPFLQFSAGAFKFLGDELFVWKDSLILSGEHFVGEIVERVVGLCCSLFGAQNKSDWRVLAGLHPVLAGIVQVEVHLPSVGVTEFTNLQIRDYEPSQTAMEENEVDAKPSVVDTEPALAAKKGKIVAQLQEEVGEPLDERFLQV